MSSKNEIIAYLAGFIDGEGCIRLSKFKASSRGGRPQYKLSISVVQVDRRPLLLLLTFFGGNIEQVKRKSYNHQDAWRWYVSRRDDIRLLLDAIQPFCIVKQEQVATALLYIDKIGMNEHGKLELKNVFYMEFKRLNAVGAVARLANDNN